MRYISTIFICLLSLSVYSQAKVRFYAQTDVRKIVEGSYFEIDFILENSDGVNFTPPSFNNFEVLSGPSQQTSVSIVNGRKSQSKSYGYALRANNKGKYTIQPASIKTNKGTLKTQAVTIEVVKGSNKKVKTEEEAFVVTEISDTNAFVGQQLILEYKLYTLLDVRNSSFLVDPSFDGFYNKNLRLTRSGYQREILNGKEYYTKILKRVALFPQQTGTYNIDGIPIQLGIATNQQSRSIFFSSRLKPMRVTSNPVKIFVRNTPDGGPYFSGAIGQYQMTVNTPKRSLTTDEAIIVIMQVLGNGDNKTVLPPKWASSDSLEIYDPNILEDETLMNGGEISHRKTFEYLIVPKIPGRYSLTGRFSYFDPDSTQFITIEKKLPSINVLKGTNKSPIIAKEKVEVYYYDYRLRKTGQKDPDIIKKNKAFGIAQERLRKAKQHMLQDESKLFHEEITIAIKKYLTDKRNIPALHLKKDELINQLQSQNLSNESMSDLKTILDKCEIALYAPVNASGMQEIYNTTEKVITALEG